MLFCDCNCFLDIVTPDAVSFAAAHLGALTLTTEKQSMTAFRLCGKLLVA